MKYLTRPFGFVVALAIAFASMVSAVQAAKPSPTAKELKAMANQTRENHRFFKQPETMVQAAATEVRMPDGTVAMAVPTELWNNLSVEHDASGKLHVLESDGTHVPVVAEKELDHE